MEQSAEAFVTIYMRKILIRFVGGALGLWFAAEVLAGVYIDDTATLVVAALLLGAVNAILRPLLIILTLPITLVTLGIFLLVINGAMVGLVAAMLDGFWVDGLGWAILASIIVTVVGWLTSAFAGSDKPKVIYKKID